jgi:molybdate transport system regulatory protein
MSSSTPKAVILRPHVAIGEAITFGPGKIDLLQKVEEGHSISGAARALGLTYKRAWALIDTLNRGFGSPVVETSSGGKGGGGARLTPLGEQLVARYLALEAKVDSSVEAELAALDELVGRDGRP